MNKPTKMCGWRGVFSVEECAGDAGWLKILIPIFAAIWNDVLWDGKNHKYANPMDLADYEEREIVEKAPTSHTKSD
eukprot:TRINITY_DN480_c0_g1_i7.p3 TRINITY_DN480_c0_g1~~TRINITY_DN480_c0_g1_i7.p3  ORF type:complete len:76 (-),score=9.07 TRINITY_DN480_c0_g1_i7:116-343(-)